ncbi:MAG: LamG-like jellyroll fold domain-containing protein [Victivallales bacterium]
MMKKSLKSVTDITVIFILFISAGCLTTPRETQVLEKPELSGYFPEFVAGVKGKCLRGSNRGRYAEDFFAASYKSLLLREIRISNNPPILNDEAGTISFWVRNDADYFWGQSIFETQSNQHLEGEMDMNRLQITLSPSQQARFPGFDELPQFMSGFTRGRISVIFTGEDGRSKTLSAPDLLMPRKWYQVGITWNPQEAVLYLDGRKVASMNEPPVPNFYKKKKLFIGKSISSDLDEFMIFKKSLSPGEMTRLSAMEDFIQDENLVFHLPFDGNVEYKVRRHHEIPFPKKAAISIPEDSYGYFSLGDELPVTIKIPAAGTAGQYESDILLLDLHNKEVLNRKTSIAASADDNTVFTELLPLRSCGLFWLNVSLKDKTGALICKKEFPLGVIVKLPPIVSVSPDSPLGGEPLIGNYMPDGRLVGMKWDRWWMYEVCRFNIEQEAGRFSWEYVDKAVEEAINAGTEILFTIHGTPDWDSTAPSDREIYEYLKGRDGSDFGFWNIGFERRNYAPKDLAHWDRFVRELVRRYKDKIHYWEIWNEPNANNFFQSRGNKPKDYVELMKTAYRAIHEEDPNAKVLGCDGCPGFLQWTDQVLSAGGGPYFDILALHNYNYTSPVIWAKQKLIERAGDLVFKATGKHIPVWNTETGFVQHPRLDGRPMDEEQFQKKYKGKSATEAGASMIPEHRAACWEVQSHLLDLAAGAEKVFLHSGFGVSMVQGNGIYRQQRLPTEKGVAYAAMAKVVNNKDKIRRIDLGNLESAGILITGKRGDNTVVLFADEEFDAYFPVSEDKEFQGMDFLGNPLTLNSENRLLRIKVDMEPIYIFDVPENFHGVQVLSVRLESKISRDSAAKGEITVTNPFSVPFSGDLSFSSLPDKWALEFDRRVSLSPGEAKSIPFSMTAKEVRRGGYPMQFSLQDERGETIAKTIWECFYEGASEPVYKGDSPIRIDGDNSDWEKVEFSKISDVIDKVVIGQPNPMFPKDFPHWKGKDDLSFAVKTAWRYDDGLYLMIKVNDDEMVTAPKDKELSCYMWDCVEIFFDGRSAERQKANPLILSEGAEQFFVIPPPAETASKCEVVFSKGTPSILAEFAGRRTKDGYFIEGVIKPAKGSDFALTPGVNFSLDVAVDDADKVSRPAPDGDRKAQMVIYGTKDNYKDTSLWGRFMLFLSR